MTEDRKLCCVGIVTFLLSFLPRWLKERLQPQTLESRKQFHKLFFFSTRDGTQGLTQWVSSLLLCHTQSLTSSKSMHKFSLWRTRPKRLFYQLLLWFLVVWIFCFGFVFYFAWPVVSQSTFADWWKHHIPANWPFMLRIREEAFSSPEHSAACEFPGSAFDWKECLLLLKHIIPGIIRSHLVPYSPFA